MKIEMGMRRAARFAVATVLAVAPAAFAQTATHTTLTAETRDAGSKTVATFSVTVADAGGEPKTGAVTLMDGPKAIASAALDSDGKATIDVDTLKAGDHAIRAVYQGTASDAASSSEAVSVHPQATAVPDFGVAIAPTTLSLVVGQAGTITATATPENGFTGFISFSCSGPPGSTTLPYGITCTFAPANVEISNTSAQSVVMSVQTSTGLTGSPVNPNQSSAAHASPVVLAILFPGVIGLGVLGRKRKRLGQVLLVVAMAGAAIAGATACNPRYSYLKHVPTYPGTNPGSYTLQVIAQTSNGVTASTHSVDLALTVTAATKSSSK